MRIAESHDRYTCYRMRLDRHLQTISSMGIFQTGKGETTIIFAVMIS